MVLTLNSWPAPHSTCPHRNESNRFSRSESDSKKSDSKKMTGLSGLNANNRNNSHEKQRDANKGYTFDPRDYGECRANHFTMFRTAAYDESSPIGSNSGYKWQPVSDLEWCRLFERTWHNKRITLSHSDSYMIESNEGKPKIQRKGKGSRGSRGRVTVCPAKAKALLNKDKDFAKHEG